MYFDQFSGSLSGFTGAPEEIRTPDPQIRSQMLFTTVRSKHRRRDGRSWRCVSVAILVAAAIQYSAKYWSEWQDLNLRPPRPERGGRAGLSLYTSVSPLPASCLLGDAAGRRLSRVRRFLCDCCRNVPVFDRPTFPLRPRCPKSPSRKCPTFRYLLDCSGASYFPQPK
jgi:hypothetical protein